MASVTHRIRSIKQPYGGYLKRKDFHIVNFDDGIILHSNENIPPTTVGMTVDYLTRFMYVKHNRKAAFGISLKGAEVADAMNKLNGIESHELKRANGLLKHISGLTDKSVINVAKLTTYDSWLRAGRGFATPDDVNPDSNTIENIITMVKRGGKFLNDYGPVVDFDFTFEGGYTSVIDSGDGDYLTKDGLWDFKVVRRDDIKPANSLQILVYYLMGLHSFNNTNFVNLDKIGLFNPRLNKMSYINIKEIDENVISEVESKVIGYDHSPAGSKLKVKRDTDDYMWRYFVSIMYLSEHPEVSAETLDPVKFNAWFELKKDELRKEFDDCF